MAKGGFSIPPKSWSNPEEGLRKVADVATRIMRGKQNHTLDLVLAPGEETTTIVSDLISPDSVIHLSPQSAAAAGVAWWVEPRAGQAIVHHPVSSEEDRIFGVSVHG